MYQIYGIYHYGGFCPKVDNAFLRVDNDICPILVGESALKYNWKGRCQKEQNCLEWRDKIIPKQPVNILPLINLNSNIIVICSWFGEQ